MTPSLRCKAPANASKLKYTGIFAHGARSTELKRASGALRSETLVCTGLTVRKLLSLSAATSKLYPSKLCVRKMELRVSELMASPKLSANARRKVSEDSSFQSVTKRQLFLRLETTSSCCS